MEVPRTVLPSEIAGEVPPAPAERGVGERRAAFFRPLRIAEVASHDLWPGQRELAGLASCREAQLVIEHRSVHAWIGPANGDDTALGRYDRVVIEAVERAG